MPMTVVSINVGLPREVPDGESRVSTGIFKHPVEGPVAVRRLNLEGDGQADLVHHGGESKAVYAYSLDHYDYWRQALGRDDLACGQFGENLTISGLDEAALDVGDQLRIGSALFVISQPRVPCFKLGVRLGDSDMPRRFAQSLRVGFYLRVLDEGTIRAGDAVEVTVHTAEHISIRSLFDAWLKPNDADALQLLARAATNPALSSEWRSHIRDRLARRGGATNDDAG